MLKLFFKKKMPENVILVRHLLSEFYNDGNAGRS